MIVDQAVYRAGRRTDCGDLSDELEQLRRLAREESAAHDDAGADADPDGRRSSDFIWIGLKDPTDEEFASVNAELKLHPLAVEDAVTGNQRVKVDVYDDTMFVSMKTLRYFDATSDIETGEVMIFVGDHFVVTVRRGDASPLRGVRRRLEHSPDRLVHGPVSVLYSVMDAIVDTYLEIDQDLEEDLEGIEHRVFSGSRGVHATQIYRLKREVLEFKRGALPLAAPLRHLAHDEQSLVPRDARPFFNDILDHVLRVIDHAEGYDRLLTDVLNVHLAQISVEQNDDMRKISAWVAMAAVPTMIAGIYGMNFHYIPELNASIDVEGHEFYWGYFAALLLMVIVAYGLYRAFRRSGWL